MLVDFYGENPDGRKAVVWLGGEMTVARGMERGKKSSGFLKAKASSGILM